jgi:NAD(P) transhydrogenase
MIVYDLVVIGSGPGGQKGAIAAAKAGKRVVLIESSNDLGGNCVYVGTLPSKSFRESVYRWSMSANQRALPPIERLLARTKRVMQGEGAVVLDQLRRNRVDIFRGHARFLSPEEIEVTQGREIKRLKTRFVLIATGAHPVPPAGVKVDRKYVFDSNSILRLKQIPKELVVLGGGIIGCEYATIFSTAGSKVRLVDKRHEILASVDREIVEHLGERMVHQGMELIFKTELEKITPLAGKKGALVHLTNGRKLKADAVLVALGRQGNTEGLGIEKAGLTADTRGLLKVDKTYRTEVPNIFAVGDVIGAPALASTSMEQGRIAANCALGIECAEMSPYFPCGIYTIPEISMVGMTEEECQAKGLDIVVGRARYRELARGQIVGDHWGLLKLVIDRKTQKLLGIHIVGDSASILVHIGQAVIALGGTLDFFIHTVFNYPTLAEAYKTAAFDAFNQLRGRVPAAA